MNVFQTIDSKRFDSKSVHLFVCLQERLREKIEAENEAKGEIQRTMSRAMAEAQIWKAKYTTEAVARIEDLENARSKLLVILIKRQDWQGTVVLWSNGSCIGLGGGGFKSHCC